MHARVRIWTVSALSLSAAGAYAVPAFDDFTSLYGYNISSGYVVEGAGAGTPIELGAQFKAAAGGTLQDIIIQMSYASVPGLFDVQLCSDSGGTIGSVLESWTGAVTDGAFGVLNPSVLLPGSGAVSLTSGTNYWVLASATNPANSTLSAAWMFNSTGAVANQASSTNYGSSWSYSSGTGPGAFEVDVVPAPEPMSVLFLAGGVVALLRRRR